MLTGRVRWYDRQRGFGFLLRDDDGTDIFFHATGLTVTAQVAIAERGRVIFDLAPGKRGDKAINIQSI